MARTVNSAFVEFMKDKVNLDSEKVSKARKSRDNLISNINSFTGDEDFFDVYKEKNLKYGSFARNTKIRELDDIDLMICLSAEGNRTYYVSYDCIYIYGNENDTERYLLTDGTSYLNSRKVIERFKSKLSKLDDYDKAIALQQNYDKAYYNRGKACEKIELFDRAIADYSKAIEITI